MNSNETNNINYHTDSILRIIQEIQNKEILLPDFQRDFVWDLQHSYDLFDSLIRDIHIGSIIYGIPSFDITVRQIDDRTRKNSTHRRKPIARFNLKTKDINGRAPILILDGQQRITSLYRACTGSDGIWITIKSFEEISNSGLDPLKKNNLEDSLYRVQGDEDPERISVRVDFVYENFVKQVPREKDLTDVFKKTKYIQSKENLKNFDSFFDREFNRFYILCQNIYDLLSNNKIVSYFLLDMNAEKFSTFFERSNSRGVTLSFVDILVAKLISSFNLREKIEEYQDENKYTINRELIARSISYISSNGKHVDKNYILNNITADDFIRNWEEVTSLYTKVYDYLFSNHLIINTKWMPYPNIILPLVIFLRNLNHKDFSAMTDRQKEFLHFWFWSTNLSSRYAGPTNELLLLDGQILTNIAKNRKISNRKFIESLHTDINRESQLTEYDRNGNAIYKGIMSFINYQAGGLTDWLNTTNFIDRDRDSFDDHHIYPKDYLKKFFDWETERNAIDNVMNRTLIPKLTNIKIKNKSPLEYMNQILQKNKSFPKWAFRYLVWVRYFA